MTEQADREAAEAFANSAPKFEQSAPRAVSNPGLYFGFVAGCAHACKAHAEEVGELWAFVAACAMEVTDTINTTETEREMSLAAQRLLAKHKERG